MRRRRRLDVGSVSSGGFSIWLELERLDVFFFGKLNTELGLGSAVTAPQFIRWPPLFFRRNPIDPAWFC